MAHIKQPWDYYYGKLSTLTHSLTYPSHLTTVGLEGALILWIACGFLSSFYPNILLPY